MQIVPEVFTQLIKNDKSLHLAILDIDTKIESIVKNQNPVFFTQYTDHGIDHFANTLRMACHLMDIDEIEKLKGQKATIDNLSPLNAFVLAASILFHDLGMHIHFKGFKQLISGYFDDVRLDFFDELTWKQEWDNFMIEAKRFSGRQRIQIFGDEQAVIRDIDFSKENVDSDFQKNLIGEFIRRHHGRLAHEIVLKGFPVENKDLFEFAPNLNFNYRDIIGLIARSHAMVIRDALFYLEEKFPADPHFPYSIDVPFLMGVIRIADYFQFDNTRTNAFLVKMKSFYSPFSLKEHQTHLATEYFKTDEKDPETLFVDLQPKDGLMYTKLLRLFKDIQQELDTTFAINGEMYGRHNRDLKIRYRRIKTSLGNRKVVERLPYVAESFKFEADTDLFKLLVGPLYGYDSSYGVRELLQNSVDACIELAFKMPHDYDPKIDIRVFSKENKYFFVIQDNGKGMSIGEIKNYFLKAGASFRNSVEWKIDYEKEDNTPAIRRTGKFGIGVLASFLIGDSIEVTTRRFNNSVGYTFNADLQNEYLEIRKNLSCQVGTTITIQLSQSNYNLFNLQHNKLTQWYLLSHPKIDFSFEGQLLNTDGVPKLALTENRQYFTDAVEVDDENFESIIWTYDIPMELAINGILIPGKYYYPTVKRYYGQKEETKNIYDRLHRFPFVSVLDKNGLIDLELNRNSIRGHLPFIEKLIESCELDFLYKLIFHDIKFVGNSLDLSNSSAATNTELTIELETSQFATDEIYTTRNGYFINNTFYTPLAKSFKFYKLYYDYRQKNQINVIDDNVYTLTKLWGTQGERSVIRGDYRSYLTVSKPEIYKENFQSKTITQYVRDTLKIVEETDDYVVFQAGNFDQSFKDKIILLFNENDALAVQVIERALNTDEYLNRLLKKHFFEPKLIPHDFEEKKAFVKSLSIELQTHITAKRKIPL